MPKTGAVRRPQTPAFRRGVLLLEHSAGSPLTRRQGSLPLTTRKLHIRGFFLHALSSDSAGCFPNAEAYTRHGTREKMFGGVGHSRAWAKKEGAAYVSEAWNAQGCHPSLATWPIPPSTNMLFYSKPRHPVPALSWTSVSWRQGYYGNPPSSQMKKSQQMSQNCPGPRVSFQSQSHFFP